MSEFRDHMADAEVLTRENLMEKLQHVHRDLAGIQQHVEDMAKVQKAREDYWADEYSVITGKSREQMLDNLLTIAVYLAAAARVVGFFARIFGAIGGAILATFALVQAYDAFVNMFAGGEVRPPSGLQGPNPIDKEPGQ